MPLTSKAFTKGVTPNRYQQIHDTIENWMIGDFESRQKPIQNPYEHEKKLYSIILQGTSRYNGESDVMPGTQEV